MLGVARATGNAARFCSRSAVILLCMGLPGCFEHKQQPPHETKNRETSFVPPTPAELAVHKRLLIIDSHIDIPGTFATEATDPGAEGNMPIDLPTIAEMNRLGIMVDVSDISKAAVMQAAGVSRAPVIASHAAVRALADVPGNLDDEALKAIARSGGVIQVAAFSSSLRKQPEKDQALEDMRVKMIQKYDVDGLDSLTDEQRKEYDNAVLELDKIWPKATIDEFIDHVDYAVKRVGIDHVGIASDFGGGGGVVDWNNAAESANVTAALLRRGYSEAQIAKLWGGNLLRVMEQVEKTSVELQGAVVSPSAAGDRAAHRRSR